MHLPTCKLLCPLQIVGAENLPRPDEAAVYVANHQSFMVGVCRAGWRAEGHA